MYVIKNADGDYYSIQDIRKPFTCDESLAHLFRKYSLAEVAQDYLKADHHDLTIVQIEEDYVHSNEVR